MPSTPENTAQYGEGSTSVEALFRQISELLVTLGLFGLAYVMYSGDHTNPLVPVMITAIIAYWITRGVARQTYGAVSNATQRALNGPLTAMKEANDMSTTQIASNLQSVQEELQQLRLQSWVQSRGVIATGPKPVVNTPVQPTVSNPGNGGQIAVTPPATIQVQKDV